MWINPKICVVGQHERVYYLKAGKVGVLVDCGSEATYEEDMDMLARDGVDLGGIEGILVSHEHFDHIGAIGRARTELRCPVVAHKLGVEAIETGDPLITAAQMSFLGVDVPFLATEVDVVVDEGDSLLLGDAEIAVFHIPGHTQGGAAFLFQGNLLVGDTIFKEGGIGWPDIHWGSCLSDHRQSIQKIADLAPTMILPGHGDPFDYDESIMDLALEKLDYLEKAGVPSRNTVPAPRRDTTEPTRRIDLAALPSGR